MTNYTISLEAFKKGLKQKPDKLPMFKQTENSFSKFKINNTDEIFYYSNFDNGLYDNSRNLLSEIVEPDQIYLDSLTEVRSLTKSNKPYWIRILLGHACNYSCDYCLQKDIGNPDERNKITTTDQFIEQLSKLDLSQLTKIDLWGGETLLYWKTIMPIMEHFDREGLVWFIPTNGTPLQMKHVDFFSKLKGRVEIGISHDGPAHARLRGPEFLDKKSNVLKALKNTNNIFFGFNPGITETNYDLFEINKFFYDYCVDIGLDINTVHLSYTMIYNHDYENIHNSADHVIRGETLNKFQKIMKNFLQASTEQFLLKTNNHNILRNNLYNSNMGVMPYIKTLKTQILPTVSTACGVDDVNVLSVDISGNVRTCPHVDESFISGHIDDINNVKLKNLDLERYENHCVSCPVFRLCKSTCPIEVPDEVFHSNCKISKVWFRSIQDEAFRIMFNGEVTLIE